MSFETANPRLTPRQLRAKFFKPIVGRESTELDVVPSNVARRWRMERAEAARRVKEAEANTKAWEDYHRRWALERQSEAAEDEQAATVVQAIAIEDDEAPPKIIKITQIQEAVCARYNVSRIDLVSSRKTMDVVLPRQIAMYLAKKLTLRTMAEIGCRFGGRDHSTVLHSVRKITSRMMESPDLAAEIADIKKSLGAE
jgi:chromosomal replication initiation ATPase DnaA